MGLKTWRWDNVPSGTTQLYKYTYNLCIYLQKNWKYYNSNYVDKRDTIVTWNMQELL
jgi:hypothetical protein